MESITRFRKAREAAGYTQTGLAEKLGISKQLLYKYENGTITNIPLDRIEAIANLCGVRPAYLAGWSDSATDEELIVELFSSLDEDRKTMAINYLRFLNSQDSQK